MHRRGRRTSIVPAGEIKVVIGPFARYSPTRRPAEILTFETGTGGIPPRTYRAFGLFGSAWREVGE